jgi:hypothetical protein
MAGVDLRTVQELGDGVPSGWFSAMLAFRQRTCTRPLRGWLLRAASKGASREAVVLWNFDATLTVPISRSPVYPKYLMRL